MDGALPGPVVQRPVLQSSSPTQLSPWHVPESSTSVAKSTALVMKRTVVTEL